MRLVAHAPAITRDAGGKLPLNRKNSATAYCSPAPSAIMGMQTGLRVCWRPPRGRASTLPGWDARRKTKPGSMPGEALQRRRPPGKVLALGVGAKSGDLPTKSLAWASAHAAECWRSTHPDCAPTRPLRGRQQALKTAAGRCRHDAGCRAFHPGSAGSRAPRPAGAAA